MADQGGERVLADLSRKLYTNGIVSLVILEFQLDHQSYLKQI